MSQTPFKNVRNGQPTPFVPATPVVMPDTKPAMDLINGDTTDVGQKSPPEIPSHTPAITNPGAGFKVRA